MKKPDIVKSMAREAGVTPGEAADRLDTVVRGILAALRKGGESALPGLGRFRHDARGKVIFEPMVGEGRRDR